MSAAKILLVDDDAQIRRALRITLASAGYTVVEARSGEEALQEVEEQNTFGVVLLDLKMPGPSGFDICPRIRKISDVPILVISVLRTQEDKVRAFEAGADDYVVKPFGTQELLARIRSLRRRRSETAPVPQFLSGGLQIDFELRRVSVDSNQVCLTPTEFGLLQLLVQHEGRPVSHRTLLQSVWGPEHTRDVERLRVAVNQLRSKIDTGTRSRRYIHTEHCFGYRFEPIAELRPTKAAESSYSQ